jgi:uncharacterized SAM-binding protein YcdF (DUF218 family)
MPTLSGGHRWRWFAFLLLAMVALVILLGSARFLVVDKPQIADVILVLAGETDRRPAHGMELLAQGMGSRLVLDVPVATIYRWSLPELAAQYAQSLPLAGKISICPIYGLSTKAESQQASRCVDAIGGKSVLLVTSDFHTRRALSIFHKELPGLKLSVAAAHDSRVFGVNWWQHREWAKTNLNEWVKLLWWQAVDRWD